MVPGKREGGWGQPQTCRRLCRHRMAAGPGPQAGTARQSPASGWSERGLGAGRTPGCSLRPCLHPLGARGGRRTPSTRPEGRPAAEGWSQEKGEDVFRLLPPTHSLRVPSQGEPRCPPLPPGLANCDTGTGDGPCTRSPFLFVWLWRLDPALHQHPTETALLLVLLHHPAPCRDRPLGQVWVRRSPSLLPAPGSSRGLGSKDGGSRGLLCPSIPLQADAGAAPAAPRPTGQSSPVPPWDPSGTQPPPAQAGSGSRAELRMHKYRQGLSPPSEGTSSLALAHQERTERDLPPPNRHSHGGQGGGT